MRTLLYVPVIHTSADLGSLAKDVARRGIADLGEDLWQAHRQTVDKFWDCLSKYFDTINVSGMKIYQDGMVAEGEIGEKIVEEGSRAGSRNYELVSGLINRGAVLVKTEDFRLVKEERDELITITQTTSNIQRLLAFIKYKFIKNRLLNKRDNFIVKRIDETMNQGEAGVLFIGAFHNIIKRLPKDIKVIQVKNASRIKEYQTLLPFYHKRKRRFEELAKYLVSEIDTVFYTIN